MKVVQMCSQKANEENKVVNEISEYVRRKFTGEASGHDWWHTYRVWKLSMKIAEKYSNVDKTVLQLAALLHDIDDWKFNGGDIKKGSKTARELLNGKIGNEAIEKIAYIIDNISFKGENEKEHMDSLEGKIVQDADRLDAIGAIGIARVFAYGGANGRPIHDPELAYKKNMTFEDYKRNKGTSINHFYEKLLLVKDRMNTEEGKRLAEKRHRFIENFLDEFYKEWNGER